MSDADRELAALAATQHGVFTCANALSAGLSWRQIERRAAARWDRLHEGVFRVPGSVATWRGELWAACAAVESLVAVSHRAAAALYGLPGGRADIVEITCRRWRRTQKPGLIVHESTQLDSLDITEVDGIAVVTAERLILELAGVRPSVDHVETVIQAARRKRLVTFESTSATFDRLARRGVRGVKPMRLALERWNPRSRPTESEMETWLTQVLRRHGLPEPVTQFEVCDELGNFVARTDAALPQWKLTIEYQSSQEHLDEFQVARDDRRRNAIIAAGYWPLAVRVRDLQSGGDVLAAEIRRIARRAAS